jgi:probable F420-dependent oxidoreductase
MQFGIVLPIWQLTMTDAETLTVKAEELGFDAVFTPDHILAKPATTQHYGPTWPDPFALLGYLAGRTRRIRLGSSVIVLPYRNPLVTAKAAATVDQVSGGRLIFGVGVGWDEAEFQDLKLAFRERGRITDEYLSIIKAAWTADVPSFSGRYFTFSGATFAPRPIQAPHPPIWVGGMPGTLSPAPMRRAAALCDGWHPLGLSLDQLAEGIAAIRDLAAKAGRPGAVTVAPRNLLSLTASDKGTGRAAFEGSPAEVVADIGKAGELGATWLTFDLPRDGVPAMVRTMERFAREVRPRVA